MRAEKGSPEIGARPSGSEQKGFGIPSGEQAAREQALARRGGLGRGRRASARGVRSLRCGRPAGGKAGRGAPPGEAEDPHPLCVKAPSSLAKGRGPRQRSDPGERRFRGRREPRTRTSPWARFAFLEVPSAPRCPSPKLSAPHFAVRCTGAERRGKANTLLRAKNKAERPGSQRAFPVCIHFFGHGCWGDHAAWHINY